MLPPYSVSPATALSKVVLPLPLSPSMQVTCPSSIDKSKFSYTVLSAYFFEKFLISIILFCSI